MTTTLIPEQGFLRDWTDLYTPKGEAPMEAHLGTALAVASATIGWRGWISWGELSEPLTMMVVLEGRSAVARKTTTASAAWKVASMATDGQEAAGLVVRNMAHTSDRGVYEAIGTTDDVLAKAWERTPPPGHLWVWDEIGALFGRPDDVKGGDWLGRIRAALMTLTAGRHGGIQTGTTRIAPSRCAVTLLGTMTRAELEARMSLMLVQDGFLGRMVLIPIGPRRTYLSRPPAWTQEDMDKRDRLVAWVRSIAGSQDCWGEAFMHHDKAALALRDTWYQERSKQFDHEAEGGDEVAVARATAFARLQATAVKMASIAALAEKDPDEPIAQVKVRERHVQWGIMLAEHTLKELAALVREGQGVTADRYARKVIDYIASVGESNRKKLLDRVRMDGMSRDARWRVVEGLAQDGSVEIEVQQTGGRPAFVVRAPASVAA
jgi:hypothetical protein